MSDQPYTPSSDPSQPGPSFGAPYDASAPTAAIKDPAVELIRQKVAALYADEPDAAREEVEVAAITPAAQSKHQQYMASLMSSGTSMPEVQAAWHEYYAGLPEQEKYEVWQEFYSAGGSAQAAQPTAAPAQTTQPVQVEQPSQPVPVAASAAVEPRPIATPVVSQTRDRALERHSRVGADSISQTAERLKSSIGGASAGEIKAKILDTVRATSNSSKRLKVKHHIQSLAFGLGCGALVLVIFLFGFFNQVVIAPLIQPSRKINDTPVIVNTASASLGTDPKVVIPKINVEIPVDYSQTTTNESEIELALDKGVVHYPITSKPGEVGNAAFFGHSSNNIFNPGKYKFAFVLLHTLSEGDIFYLNYNGKTYAYKVFSKQIVPPTQVDVLNPIAGHPATATLITCDPPGTSINRLVVVGDQISPDINGNSQPTPTEVASTGSATTASANLPGNGPTLWSRIWNSIF